MNFEPVSFFRAYVRNVGKDIDSTKLHFGYADVSYKQFMEIYGDIDKYHDHDSHTFINPFPVVLELVSHVAYGVFKGITAAFRGDLRPLVCTVFYVIRDCQEIVGRITTLFFSGSEPWHYGIYLAEKSRFEKRCYDQFMKEACSSEQAQAAPPPPAEKQKFAFWMRCAESYYDAQEYVKAYEVIRCGVLEREEEDRDQLKAFEAKLADKLFETKEYSLACHAARFTIYGRTFLFKVADQLIVEHRYKEALETLDLISFEYIPSIQRPMVEQHRQLCLRIVEEALNAGEREIAKGAADAIISLDFKELLSAKRRSYQTRWTDEEHLDWVSDWVRRKQFQPYTHRIVNGLQAGATKEQINALLTAYVNEESARLFEEPKSGPSFASHASNQSSYSAPIYGKNLVQAIRKGLVLPNEYQTLYAMCKDENPDNYYKIFELKPGWKDADLKKSFKNLLLKLHVDKHQGSPYYADILVLVQHINAIRDYLDPSKD